MSAIDDVRGVVTLSMDMVRELIEREPAVDVLQAVDAIETDAGRAVVLLGAARNRLTCMDHFLADECPEDCVEGQLQRAIDVFLDGNVLPQPKDTSAALGQAIDLATAGHQVTIETDGTISSRRESVR